MKVLHVLHEGKDKLKCNLKGWTGTQTQVLYCVQRGWLKHGPSLVVILAGLFSTKIPGEQRERSTSGDPFSSVQYQFGIFNAPTLVFAAYSFQFTHSSSELDEAIENHLIATYA